MSGDLFVSIQRRILYLFDHGANMSNEELELTLDGLVGTARNMVRFRQVDVIRSRSHLSPSQAMRTEPQFVEIRSNSPFTAAPAAVRPAAELRPAALPITSGQMRPSVLLRNIQSQVQQRIQTPPLQELPQLPAYIRWETYSRECMKRRAIGKARFDANCNEVCAICLDTHTNGESVVTEECQHCFGKECWQNWMSNPTGNQKCPTCRKDCPSVIFYSKRAERMPKGNNLVEANLSTTIDDQEV
ncbi:RING-H2 finger protein [bacterium]|nr:RING-H2 finger protein [bacterium]